MKTTHTPALAFIQRIDEIIRQGRPSDHLWNYCVENRDAALADTTHAVNCHEELVAALKRYVDGDWSNRYDDDKTKATRQIARAALARAERNQ